MKKILSFPIKTIVWIGHNPSETILLSIFVLAILPFFMNVGSPALVGGFASLCSCISEKYMSKYKKSTKTYNILSIIILILGTTAIFIVGGKDYKSVWSPTDNMWSTYMGAFWGMMSAHLIISFIDSEKKERQKRKELEMVWRQKQEEQKIIFEKEKEGFVAIKRDGKLIGYIEKEKYDDFVNKNIHN